MALSPLSWIKDQVHLLHLNQQQRNNNYMEFYCVLSLGSKVAHEIWDWRFQRPFRTRFSHRRFLCCAFRMGQKGQIVSKLWRLLNKVRRTKKSMSKASPGALKPTQKMSNDWCMWSFSPVAFCRRSRWKLMETTLLLLVRHLRFLFDFVKCSLWWEEIETRAAAED